MTPQETMPRQPTLKLAAWLSHDCGKVKSLGNFKKPLIWTAANMRATNECSLLWAKAEARRRTANEAQDAFSEAEPIGHSIG